MHALMSLVVTFGLVSDIHCEAALAERDGIDLRPFQGQWKLEKCEVDGQDCTEQLQSRTFRIAGAKLILPDSPSFTLVAADRSARTPGGAHLPVDLRSESGTTFKAIYFIKRDRLRIAISAPQINLFGSGKSADPATIPRPTSFDSRKGLGEGTMLIVVDLKRAP